MKAPILNEQKETREMIDTFLGYNHNLQIGDGEFYDMKNMSSLDYPVLSPREKRGIYSNSDSTDPVTGIADDTLLPIHTQGTKIYIGNIGKEMNLSTDVSMCPKTIVRIGSYAIVMPDKKYINIHDSSDQGNIDREYTVPSGTDAETSVASYVRFRYVPVGIGNPATEFSDNKISFSKNLQTALSPDDYDAQWITTKRKMYIHDGYSWVEQKELDIQMTYKSKPSGLSYPDLTEFEEGQTITISGILRKTGHFGSPDYQDFLNGDYTVVKVLSSDSLILRKTNGIDPTFFCEPSDKSNSEYEYFNDVFDSFTIGSYMPNLDYIIESENRLWGCRYGKNRKNEFVNEIYASKQGDFRSWSTYYGSSTDSYAATVGIDSPFTGAVTYLGHPIFFKENCMHIVYGNYPSNYQIKTTMCRGVQGGCSRSIAIVNETLFYKSRSAICAYDGSLPVEVSYSLGDTTYSKAVAGSGGNKYYISMKDEDDKSHLFVYDTKLGIWNKEDDLCAIMFATAKSRLYCLDASDNKVKIMSEKDESLFSEDSVEWMVETGVIGTTSPDKKYVSALNVRLCIEFGTQISFFLQYDSDGEWVNVYNAVGTNILRSFTIPIKPKRCDHFRMRIEGIGGAKIYSICKTITQGSDV